MDRYPPPRSFLTLEVYLVSQNLVRLLGFLWDWSLRLAQGVAYFLRPQKNQLSCVVSQQVKTQKMYFASFYQQAHIAVSNDASSDPFVGLGCDFGSS